MQFFKKSEPIQAQKRAYFLNFYESFKKNFLGLQSTVDEAGKLIHPAVTEQSRNLALNSATFMGILKCIERNVIGTEGFRLETAYTNRVKINGVEVDEDDKFLNELIKKLWLEYTKKENFSLSETQNFTEFLSLALKGLCIDGEIFVQKHFDNSKFGVKWELLDALCFDTTYNVDNGFSETYISQSIEYDRATGKPVNYHYSKIINGRYSKTRIIIPASEIIHIYKPIFVSQKRGIPPIYSASADLEKLEEYKKAELTQAIIQSSLTAFMEQTSENDTSYNVAGSENNSQITMDKTLKAGQLNYIPKGFSVKQLQNNHPSNSYGIFTKNILRNIANSLGISYNKALGDYESTNYNSLRESQLEDQTTYKEMQNFLIENLILVQFRAFVEQLFLNSIIDVNAGDLEKICDVWFKGKIFPWVDPLREASAIEKKLSLYLTDPITEIEAVGKEPSEVIQNWVRWTKMLQANNLPMFAIQQNPQLLNTLLQADEEAGKESTDDEKSNDNKDKE